MSKQIFILPVLLFILSEFSACTSWEEPLGATYEFRRKAVREQVNNLVGDIRKAYDDDAAVMKYLDTFIKKNPRVCRVTFASVPMAKHPFSVSMTEVKASTPKPIGKYFPMVNFNDSPDMEWYREALVKEIPFWYKLPLPSKDTKLLSYIYPVFTNSKPAIMLYVLKLDFTKNENPILFWNVPQKLYEQQLAEQEEIILKKIAQLKKEVEQKEIDAVKLEQLKEAQKYYELQYKKLLIRIKEHEKFMKKRLEPKLK